MLFTMLHHQNYFVREARSEAQKIRKGSPTKLTLEPLISTIHVKSNKYSITNAPFHGCS